MSEQNIDILGDLGEFATDIAIQRVDEIERRMRVMPERFRNFTNALTDIEREERALIQKLGNEFALEPLLTAYMAYHSELVFEVYKQAALDGGRVYHAFITHELPKEDAE